MTGLRLAGIMIFSPEKFPSADAEDDDYLDDENAGLEKHYAGAEKALRHHGHAGSKPGETGQKNWLSCLTPAKFAPSASGNPNGTVDVFRGWLSSLAKP
ncbi:hypothetical protein KCP76_24755 [Salmonella enterica subsp. enterica serovar Weltevreden]|nr:hypothetical protein KCP76_24755 [Salmonella enterica subsp. enterica serovar Weltevreden]